MAVLFFVNGASVASWLPRLPEIQSRLDVTTGGLGLTLVGAGLGGTLMSVVSGHATDRVGSRRLAVATSVVLCALLPLVGLAAVPVALFAVLVALGSLDGLTDVAMNRQAIMVQHRLQVGDGRRHVVTRMHGLWSLGAVVGGLVASRAAAAEISLRAQLLVTAPVLVAATLLAGRWLLPDPPHPDHQQQAGTGRRRRPVSVRGLARLAVVGIAVALAEMAPNDWSSLMWADHYELAAGRAAFGYVAFACGMVAGRFAGDWIVARAGGEATRRAGAAVAAASFALAALAPAPWLSGVGLFATGLGVAQLFPLMFVAASAATSGNSIGMAAFSSGARFGFLAGPPLVGGLADLTSVATAVLVVGGIAALAVAATPLHPPPKLE